MKTRTQATRKTGAQTTAPAAPAPQAHDEAPAPEIAAQLDAGAHGHSFGALAVSAAPQGAIQPKLAVGAPDDQYEAEADRVASQVMRTPDPAAQRAAAADDNRDLPYRAQSIEGTCPVCGRQGKGACPDCGQPFLPQIVASTPSGDEANAGRSLARPDNAETPIQRSVSASESSTQELMSSMEAAFDTTFSDVRLYPDSASAARVGALAYARSDEIHFADGMFQPGSPSGRHLLGHELAHVVQQRQGRVEATTHLAGEPLNLSAELEQEAHEAGALAAQGGMVSESMRGSHSNGASQNQVIQGVFPDDRILAVAPGAKIRAYNRTSLNFEDLNPGDIFYIRPGNTEPVNSTMMTYYTITSYHTGIDYDVDQSEIKHGPNWASVPRSAGTSFRAPNIGALQVDSSITNAKGRGKNSEPVRKKRAAPREKGDMISRPDFESKPKKLAAADTFKFFSPGTESTGAERIPQFEERESQSQTAEIKLGSLVGGPATDQVITYCSYCLQWFTPSELDSDHAVTWKDIGLWLTHVAGRMNKEGDVFVTQLDAQFRSVHLNYLDFFRQFGTPPQWQVTENGAFVLFNNVKNLALSCKTCNQLERNDEKFRSFTGRHMHFGQPFLDWLDKNFTISDTDIATETGQFAGELIHLWTKITPNCQKAIEMYRRIKLTSHNRVERVKRFTASSQKGDVKKALGAEQKEQMLATVDTTLQTEYGSEGEEEHETLVQELPKIIVESKRLLQQGVQVRPRQDVEDAQLMAGMINRLLEERDEALQENRNLRDELDEVHVQLLDEQLALQQSMMEEGFQHERATMAEQKAANLEEANQRLIGAHSQVAAANQELQMQNVGLHGENEALRSQLQQAHAAQMQLFQQLSALTAKNVDLQQQLEAFAAILSQGGKAPQGNN